MTARTFSNILLHWFDENGRKDLPWQHPRSPYFVWLSEIMLQQTQVKTVIPYFERFTQHFPDITSLADAPIDAVMALWSGLGYYSRARNLHRAAQIIRDTYGSTFPNRMDDLLKLPGIGNTTAAAICAQAYNQATAILDANVKRVFSRIYRIDDSKADGQKELWRIAQRHMPAERCADYTQAIMDFGALYCRSKNPLCTSCPFTQSCAAFKHQQVSLYPVKKTRKTRPEREQHYLLITASNGVYLVKNPPKGIWGGLWMLPTYSSEHSDDTKTSPLTPPDLPDIRPYGQIKHSFSHFHLTLHVWHINFHPRHHGHLVSEIAGRWTRHDELSQIGLPRPIQQILTDGLPQTR
ncbi:MAG: A/G-specific adenine glycosylase [Legionellaceae bacterium]|nr:A/G-specific adenine glycosylase [Legionellaceae bacterium]